MRAHTDHTESSKHKSRSSRSTQPTDEKKIEEKTPKEKSQGKK